MKGESEPEKQRTCILYKICTFYFPSKKECSERVSNPHITGNDLRLIISYTIIYKFLFLE